MQIKYNGVYTTTSGDSCKLEKDVPSFREGDGTPLQYSCLENPRDGRAWWAAVYGVAESDTTEAT